MSSTPAPVVRNAAASRFEIVIDGHLAECVYRLHDRTLELVHTEVPAALQGMGLAGQLVQAALDWARTEGLRVRPTCAYAANYMRRRPETHDLLDAPLA